MINSFAIVSERVITLTSIANEWRGTTQTLVTENIV